MKRVAFISHSSADRTVADEICRFLEANSIPCWIAPRDVTPGKNYGAAILDAIDECSIFVLLLTSESNKSTQVVREVERAASSNSTIIPFRVEDVQPSRNLEFYVSATHWLDAITKPLDKHLRELLRAIRNWQESKTGAVAPIPVQPAPLAPPPLPSVAPARRNLPLSTGMLTVVIAAAVLLCAIAAFWVVRSASRSTSASTAQASPSATEPPALSETATPEPSAPESPITPTPAETVAPPPITTLETPAPIRRRPGELLRTPSPSETVATPSPTPSIPHLRPAVLPRPSPSVSPPPPKVIVKEVAASSELHLKGTARKAAMAFDGKLNTAWVPEDDGVGQSISVHFKVPAVIKSVSILGALGGEAEFRVRNRVHTLRITLSDGTNQVLTFEDKPQIQRFELVHPVTANFAKFDILTVYRGKKLNHTPISEIVFNRETD